jgi:hypothetical protein
MPTIERSDFEVVVMQTRSLQVKLGLKEGSVRYRTACFESARDIEKSLLLLQRRPPAMPLPSCVPKLMRNAAPLSTKILTPMTTSCLAVCLPACKIETLRILDCGHLINNPFDVSMCAAVCDTHTPETETRNEITGSRILETDGLRRTSSETTGPACPRADLNFTISKRLPTKTRRHIVGPSEKDNTTLPCLLEASSITPNPRVRTNGTYTPTATRILGLKCTTSVPHTSCTHTNTPFTPPAHRPR